MAQHGHHEKRAARKVRKSPSNKAAYGSIRRRKTTLLTK